MPPQNKESLMSFPVEDDDFALVPEDEHHDEIEERKLEINFKQMYNNLQNLDYSKVRWRNVILFVVLHLYSVYGLYLAITSATWLTLLFASGLYLCTGLGITMGVHRLWAHRSYKAVLPLRILLAVCQTVAFQNSIYEWSRDHRTHHKFSETNADPHNAHRGFFFSHMGWLMVKKHPDVLTKGKTLDMSDLLNDPVVRIQHKYYIPLVLLGCFVIPTVVPWYYWNEGIVNALFIAGFLRYCITLHFTWFVNSLAHWVGAKPYDKQIYPSQNKLVSALAMGEGWHNYHHVFPFDYRAAELGGIFNLNFTTEVIDLFAKIGWTYDRKVASEEMIKKRIQRTGGNSKAKNLKKKT